METTDKKSAQQLTEILWQKGVEHIVISPGSRNAPLILGFTAHSKYTCYSVPDERSAAFIALGVADETKNPVALVCSSGSALLNYYPAIAEAFYRHIPLIVLSADRPEFLIDQGDGQTIRQQNVFANHILYSTQLEENPIEKEAILFNEHKINEALNMAIETVISKPGPVHLNLPFTEPLYNKVTIETNSSRIVFTSKGSFKFPDIQIVELTQLVKSATRVMILVGQQDFNEELQKLLNQISKDTLILTETTSNIPIENSISCIDQLIMPLRGSKKEDLQPDVLITFGGNVVSKKIKSFLREFSPKQHFHIENTTTPPNTYQCLTHSIQGAPEDFFHQVPIKSSEPKRKWVNKWMDRTEKRKIAHANYLNSISHSDIKVMESIVNLIPENCIVHLANSTPVRYAQLFHWPNQIEFKSNRGTSGIDGIVSTAMGNAMVTNKPVYLIVGDISFFYDTNAWWHRHIPENLKVVVINNSGGGIFRFIDGPANTGQLEQFFETTQKNSVEHIAKGFEVDYFCANDLKEFEIKFSELKNHTKSSILEVFTPRESNAIMLKDYFKSLKIK